MIYLRLNYDHEYGNDAHKHPVIEVIKEPVSANDLQKIAVELTDIFKPDFLSKTKLRILRK